MPSLRLVPPQGWPTLGWVVIDWIEAYLCHGPGDVQGSPLLLDDEFAQFVLDAYRIYPKGHARAGRRVVTEAELSRPKGRAKSELAGAIACAEFRGPVRFDGWDARGDPVGKQVTYPFIRCNATEEGQAGNTYDNIEVMLDHAHERWPDVFAGVDTGKSRVELDGGKGGEIRPSTAAAASQDGGKETLIVEDETHLYVSPNLRAMHATGKRNLRKRKAAQPWLLMTTTQFQPGQNSVAEANRIEAEKELLSAKRRRLGFMWDHREGSEVADWADDKALMASLREAYGPAAEWMDLDGLLTEEIRSHDATEPASRRFFLNQSHKGESKAIDPATWRKLENNALTSTFTPETPVVLCFKGSKSRDSTSLLAWSVAATPHLFVLETWERPVGPAGAGWRVPRAEVRSAVTRARESFAVRRFVCDPHGWQEQVDEWAEVFGDDAAGDPIVLEFWTNQPKRMGQAIDRLLDEAIPDGTFTHDGDECLARHAATAVRGARGGHTTLTAEKDTETVGALVAAVIGYDELGNIPLTEPVAVEPFAFFD